MLNNDLSNRSAPTVAFRLEDFLLEMQKTNLKEKAKNVWKGNYKMTGLNDEVVQAINFIFRSTDMNAYLVKENDTKLNEYEEELLNMVSYSRIVPIIKPVDITRLLMTGEFTYYIDRNLDRMNLVNHKNCLGLAELNQIIRR